VNELTPASTFQPDRPSGGPVTSTDRLSTEIAALDGLDLEALRTLWKKLYRHPAPRYFRCDLLIRGIAYEMQAKAYGGLSPKTRRTLLKIAAGHEAGTGFTTADAPRKVRAGTRLVRAWKGVTHTVNVLADGFEWNGQKYRSLSAIAREISGTNWNGFNFFGLDRQKKGENNG
jgi:hypothetical protein